MFFVSAASISASGVPARAEITSSLGSYSVMPVRPRVESRVSATTGRPSPARVPPPSMTTGLDAARVALMASTVSASLLGVRKFMALS